MVGTSLAQRSRALTEELRRSATLRPSASRAMYVAGSKVKDSQAAANEPAIKGHEELAGVPPVEEKKKGGVLMTIAKGMAALTDLEQAISTPFASIPFPGIPALRIGDVAVGLMHAHGHPPNVVGPGPPIPLASVGALIKIPYLSGAETVLTTGSAAARCGDMGLAALAWCGGYFPLLEVSLGSASVWIEGSRAARVAVDITTHCVFSAPKPKDRPIGPWNGATVSGETSVLIGGIPMPSLVSIALGKAFQAAFKGLKWAFKGISAIARKSSVLTKLGQRAGERAKALGNKLSPAAILRRRAARNAARNARVNQFLDEMMGPNGTVIVSPKYRARVARDLDIMSRTPEGKKLLKELRDSGKQLVIVDPKSKSVRAAYRKSGAHCSFGPDGNIRVGPAADPNVPTAGVVNHPQKGQMPLDNIGRGPGSDARVVYDPKNWPRRGRKTPSDIVGFHELTHARNAHYGEINPTKSNIEPWNDDWKNMEEFNTVKRTNRYRIERNQIKPSKDQLPLREDYTSPLA